MHFMIVFMSLITLARGADSTTIQKISNGVSRDDHHVYFNGQLVKTLDSKSVQLIHEKIGAKWSTGYLRDRNGVFIYSDPTPPTLIVGADPATFEILDRKTPVFSYTRDKNHIFFGVHHLKVADRDSFKPMGAYGKDSMHAFYQEKMIVDVDASTFVLIDDCDSDHFGPRYSKDKNRVYFRGVLVPLADPNTFKMVCDPKFDARDAKRVFLNGKLLDPPKP